MDISNQESYSSVYQPGSSLLYTDSDSIAWTPVINRSSKDSAAIIKNSRTNNKHHQAEHTDNNVIPYQNHAIRIFTLGRFSVVINNQSTQFPAKGHKKSLELLKTLIALGGREVGEVRISEALWPDSDGDVAHTTFSVTLHRLRKLIGNEALLLSDGRLTLNANHCWVDAWAGERTIGKLKQLLNTRPMDPNYVKHLANELIELYHGPYLGNEDEQPWFLSYRERLHSKFVRCLLEVGAYLEKNNLHDTAIGLYQHGLDIDDLSENTYLRLMKCYQNLGRRAEAIKVFQRYRAVLAAHYAVEPSQEMVTVYNSLKKCA